MARDLVGVCPLACDLARRAALASVQASQLILGHLERTLGASWVQLGRRRRMALPKCSRLCMATPASAALRIPMWECELAPRMAEVAIAPPG